jgi:GNAT superfamily N-acetyltransferase
MDKNIKTRIDGFTIRFGEEKDAGIIYNLVKELAEYEKLLDSLEVTEELLKETRFHRGVVEAIIGEYKHKPVAYAIFFHTFSSFTGRIGIFIEDLYVKPQMRRKGLGEIMFSFIAKLAMERKCGRLEWSCLDWNKPSIAFYKKMEAVALDEWTTYRLAGRNLEKVAGEF